MSIGQASFVPIQCTRTKAPPDSADADCIAICDNTGQPYLCKSVEDDPLLPATEWLCSHMARDCGLPVPACNVIAITGRQDLLFGSEWQGGGQNWAVALPNVKNGFVFSKTLAFDFTAHNVDRHLNNYLYLDLAGETIIKIIDFSRAWMFHGWPLPPLPMGAREKTVAAFPYWNNLHPFVITEANCILQKWANLPDDYLEGVFQCMPEAWLDNQTKNKLREWWESPARAERAEEVRKCLP